MGIAAVVCISNLIATRGSRNILKGFMVVSTSSYIIYLFHTTFEGFTKAIVHKVYASYGIDGDLWFVLTATCVIMTGVICPIILHRYILGRYKVTKILFGLK